MNLDALMKLVDAGFTKDDIMKMTAPAPAPAPETAPAPAPETAPAPAPGTDALLDAIGKLTSTLQSQAIRGSNITGVTQPQTAEQVLAEIIHPTFKGGNES